MCVCVYLFIYLLHRVQLVALFQDFLATIGVIPLLPMTHGFGHAQGARPSLRDRLMVVTLL